MSLFKVTNEGNLLSEHSVLYVEADTLRAVEDKYQKPLWSVEYLDVIGLKNPPVNRGSDANDKNFEIKSGKTERGFGLNKFTDLYGQLCSLQDSSLATTNAIWFGVDTDLNGRDCTRMHLSDNMVEKLLPILQRFVEKGYVREE